MAKVLRRAEQSSALIEAQWARQQRRARRQRTNSIVADNLSLAVDANEAAAAATAAADAMRFSTESDEVSAEHDEMDATTLESLELEREQSHFVRLFRLPRDEVLRGHYKSARFALRRFDEAELEQQLSGSPSAHQSSTKQVSSCVFGFGGLLTHGVGLGACVVVARIDLARCQFSWICFVRQTAVGLHSASQCEKSQSTRASCRRRRSYARYFAQR